MNDQSSSASQLHKQAIDAALDSKWEEAVKLNQEIIKIDPKNIDALNRIARAYFELEKLNLALKYYSEVLEYDEYNPIAQKNLKIIKTFKKVGKTGLKNNGEGNHNIRISPSLFLQEPGKTKLVNLLKVAEPQKLSMVYPGMQVDITPKNRGLCVSDYRIGYLGVLPDDVSFQILRFIKGGNQYQAFIKSVKVNGLSILIREVFRSKKFKNQPSFLEQQHDSGSSSREDIFASLNADDDSDGEDRESSDDSQEEI